MRAYVLAVFAMLLLLTHCTPYVFAPPAKMVSLESAATLHKGEVAVQAEGGAHFGTGFFQADSTWSGTARVKYGFTGKLDGSLEATTLHSTGTYPKNLYTRLEFQLMRMPFELA